MKNKIFRFRVKTELKIGQRAIARPMDEILGDVLGRDISGEIVQIIPVDYTHPNGLVVIKIPHGKKFLNYFVKPNDIKEVL